MKLDDLTGKRYGKLVVLDRAANIGRQVAWRCQCDCGNEKTTTGWNLKSGQCLSCGCIVKETSRMNPVKHGQSYTRLYHIWIGMKQRCYYAKHRHYDRYGGRGITVCAEWVDDFDAFYDWSMEHGYTDNLTIDRIDVDGSYSPSNCRWITLADQNGNTSKTKLYEANGEKHTIAEWSRITGIPKSTIRNRLCRGKTIENALKKGS